MYCPECGHQNSEAANYCARCGALIVADQPGGQTTMSYPPAEIETEDGEPAGDLDDRRAGAGHPGRRWTRRRALRRSTTTRSRSAARETADILLDDVTVSRLHAMVRRRPDGLYIEDADSLNGTYVNRRRIESHRLADGDELQIGKFKLTYLER